MIDELPKDYENYKNLGIITKKKPKELKKHYELGHYSCYWYESKFKYFFCEKCKIKWKKKVVKDVIF